MELEPLYLVKVDITEAAYKKGRRSVISKCLARKVAHARMYQSHFHVTRQKCAFEGYGC